MNLDMNAMSMLMQMLSQKNDGQKAQYEPPNAQNARPRAYDDNRIEKPAFALQNGIGEQIRLDFSPPEENRDVKTDFLKSLAGQNPMLSLLCNMQNGKADVASMLPLVMSLMQKPKTSEQPKTDEKSNEKADVKCESNGNKSERASVRTSQNCNSNDNDTNNNQNSEKEKTQRDPFYPVAFAGYEVISSLYALIKASRRPCR
ncbi:MAG TPA: hypothetical protein DCS37_00125 [Clostridiales bacterium]|nr:hypothetical protein [Clostridiales bacterium]